MLLKVILHPLEFDAIAKRASVLSFTVIALQLVLLVMSFVIVVDVTIIRNQRIERKLSNRLLSETQMLSNLKLMSLGSLEPRFRIQMN